MKNSLLITGLIGCSIAFNTPVLADTVSHSCIGIPGSAKNTYYGPTNCNGVDIANLTVQGYLLLTNHSVVHGELITNGIIDMNDSEVGGTLTCHGLLNSKNSIINGAVSEAGNIQAASTQFRNNITLDPQVTQSTVTLSAASTVNGDVIFNGSMPGIVYLRDGSRITGKVVNGIVEK